LHVRRTHMYRVKSSARPFDRTDFFAAAESRISTGAELSVQKECCARK